MYKRQELYHTYDVGRLVYIVTLLPCPILIQSSAWDTNHQSHQTWVHNTTLYTTFGASLRSSRFVLSLSWTKPCDIRIIPYLRCRTPSIHSNTITSVSYTHLDVYKRQGQYLSLKYFLLQLRQFWRQRINR